jgi:hypothetical protein
MMGGAVLRVARPTDRLREITRMYVDGLGAAVLDEFVDHDGFDGVIIGHPEARYHLEFTARHGEVVGRSPTKDHLLVFYLPHHPDWDHGCARMTAAGFRSVPAYNPYWDLNGKTFEDPDGYRVVLQRSAWPRGQHNGE